MGKIYHKNFLFGPRGRYDVGIEYADADGDPGDSHIVIHDTVSGEDRHYKLVRAEQASSGMKIGPLTVIVRMHGPPADDTPIQDDPYRELACDIIEHFCGLLSDKGMKVPSDDREGNDDEAPIYGAEYYELEDAITRDLKEHTRLI